MINYAEYILRSYFKATEWNPDAQYSNLNRASAAILDFAPPSALSVSVSSHPTHAFASSCGLSILPSLTGSVAYLASSVDLPRTKPSLGSLVHTFGIPALPATPASSSRDQLLYGQLHLPSSRLHALYARRLAPHAQLTVSSTSHANPREPSDMYLAYQTDRGHYASEAAYSVADGMASASALFHFGVVEKGEYRGEQLKDKEKDKEKDVHSTTLEQTPLNIDEEADGDGAGGLRGHFSLGGELYASAQEKSAGVSTGLRFQTLPNSHSHHSPPTVLVALLSPITGYLSGTYAATVARGLSLASRFEFNLFSYESVTTVGAEWAMHRSDKESDEEYWDENLQELVNPIPLSASMAISDRDPVQGYLKARVSTEKSVALQYVGRLKSLLVSLGLVADLTNPSKPVQSIGIELQYLSQGNDAE